MGMQPAPATALAALQTCAANLDALPTAAAACAPAAAAVLQSGAAPSPECQDVSEVVARLQARQGQQLWPREQPSLAHPVVPSAAAVALFVQTGAGSGEGGAWKAGGACTGDDVWFVWGDM